MKKIKQFADKAFVRPDRTEVLSEDLQEAERRIDLIKQSCESTAKKVSGCLQAQGKDGGDIGKRIRKVPEFVLGSNMVTNGKQFSGTSSVLGEVLHETGTIEMKLAQEMVEYEVKIEELILKPLQTLMDNDLPNIYKLKRTLGKLTENMDTARLKFQQASRSSSHSMSSASTGKIDNFKDEWDDSQQKVEQCRDNLAAEMYALIARESEISKYIVEFLNYQKDYHKQTYLILEELVPEVEVVLKNSSHKPSYGVELKEHLEATQKTIAYPIELCVCGLLEMALEEEGLFRIAGSASKVKKLKSAFDAGLMDLKALMTEFGDPHVIANALKCYLRELPSPLLTAELYDEWLAAITASDANAKLQALWKAIHHLPTANQDNLRYLVKFLRELSKHQDKNKMSPVNIAIVIAPNLMWGPTNGDEQMGDNTAMGLNMTMTHLYSSVLEQLITYSDYFFPNDIEYFITCTKPTEQELHRGSVSTVNGSIDEGSEEASVIIKRSQSTSSIEEHSPPGSPKPMRRRKNKPAPVPPCTYNSKVITQSPNPPSNIKEKSFAAGDTTKTAYSAGGLQSFQLNKFSQNKREGAVLVPPSPSQMENRKISFPPDTSVTNIGVNKIVPPKPPQPQINIQSITDGPSRAKFPPIPTEPPPKPASPLRHKSSFKVIGSSNAMDNESAVATTSSGSTSTIGGGNINAFSSLPRHFQTENSYKRAPRPPSIFATAPVPPTVSSTGPMSLPPQQVVAPSLEKETNQSEATAPNPSPKPLVPPQIGFEKVMMEVISTEEKNNVANKPKDQEQLAVDTKESDKLEISDSASENCVGAEIPVVISRPVPAPRSSLLQSNSFTHTTSSGISPNVTNKDKDNIPVVKERPSLMAKPRDLAKRSQSTNVGLSGGDKSSGSGGDSDNPECPPSSVNIKGSNISTPQNQLSEKNSIELNENGGLKLEKADEHGYGYLSRTRPPRPHPPPPPKNTTRPPLPGESTDL